MELEIIHSIRKDGKEKKKALGILPAYKGQEHPGDIIIPPLKNIVRESKGAPEDLAQEKEGEIAERQKRVLSKFEGISIAAVLYRMTSDPDKILNVLTRDFGIQVEDITQNIKRDIVHFSYPVISSSSSRELEEKYSLLVSFYTVFGPYFQPAFRDQFFDTILILGKVCALPSLSESISQKPILVDSLKQEIFKQILSVTESLLGREVLKTYHDQFNREESVILLEAYKKLGMLADDVPQLLFDRFPDLREVFRPKEKNSLDNLLQQGSLEEIYGNLPALRWHSCAMVDPIGLFPRSKVGFEWEFKLQGKEQGRSEDSPFFREVVKGQDILDQECHVDIDVSEIKTKKGGVPFSAESIAVMRRVMAGAQRLREFISWASCHINVDSNGQSGDSLMVFRVKNKDGVRHEATSTSGGAFFLPIVRKEGKVLSHLLCSEHLFDQAILIAELSSFPSMPTIHTTLTKMYGDHYTFHDVARAFIEKENFLVALAVQQDKRFLIPSILRLRSNALLPQINTEYFFTQFLNNTDPSFIDFLTLEFISQFSASGVDAFAQRRLVERMPEAEARRITLEFISQFSASGGDKDAQWLLVGRMPEKNITLSGLSQFSASGVDAFAQRRLVERMPEAEARRITLEFISQFAASGGSANAQWRLVGRMPEAEARHITLE